MKEAYIVSGLRSPVGKAKKGGLRFVRPCVSPHEISLMEKVTAQKLANELKKVGYTCFVKD